MNEVTSRFKEFLDIDIPGGTVLSRIKLNNIDKIRAHTY
jgi:hypothetical protein